MYHRDASEIGSGLFSALAALSETTSASEMPTVLTNLRDNYGLKSIAYLGAGLKAPPNQAPYLAVTYPDEWVERYQSQRFVDIDPAVQIGMRRMLPIDWDEFDRSDNEVRHLFGEAMDFGLGRHGITLPVQGRYGDRALVSITSDVNDRDWQHLRLLYMRDFQLLALHMHQAIVRLEGQPMEQVRLSPRERECLLWVAEGKSAWETAVILGLSEHTVRCYLESARHKLSAANNTHAVNKAGKASLLNLLP